MKWFIVAAIVIMVFFMAIYWEPKKEEEERYQKQAFKLTKAIGDKNIQCVSVITSYNDRPGRAFYLMEENAENDSTKYCERLTEGWDNSAYPIESARKDAHCILAKMPYDIAFIDTNQTWSDFFGTRIRDENLRQLDKDQHYDESLIDDHVPDDFYNVDVSIVRYIMSEKYDCFYCYYLKLEQCGIVKGYVYLFKYRKSNLEYAQMRIDHFCKSYNKLSNNKIDNEVLCVDMEMDDFLKSHPNLATFCPWFHGLISLRPYYEEDNK